VIHVHGIRPVGIAAAECRSLDRVPMICTLHGVDTSLLSAYAANRVIRDSVNRFWQRCDRVIVVGNAIVPYARQLGVPEDKIEVIYNGTFLPPRCEERDHHGCVKIGSISNLQELKGIDLNLRALAKIRCSQQTLSWTYEIVGDGPERENLVNLTNELGLNDLVTFHGRVSYEKTMALLQEMDVFSLPSWREALGIVYLEAISRGKPIIGCKAWGAGDVVGDSECGLLVADKNVSELEGALVSLIGNDEQRKLMGQRAFERAKSFSWEINVRKHLDLFDSLIATKTN
jgi:glycosyltransferase involved in cell wall biosynthesis